MTGAAHPGRHGNAPRGRRRVVGAVLGVGLLTGLGITSTGAAWTDDTWIATSAGAATVDLRGSADAGATWSEADTTGTALVLGPVTGLTPATPRTLTVQLWNASTVPLALGSTTDEAALGDCVVVDVELAERTVPGDPTGQDPAAFTTATVTFGVAPDADAGACSGARLDAVEIVFQGSTS